MTQQHAELLSQALKEHFGADVDAESIDGNGRYRFTVVSPQFQTMSQLQRQDAAWEVADKVLDRAAALGISLILTFAPSELAETGT